MMQQTATSAPPRCDANSTGRAATDWGEHALPCQTTRGLRSHIDATGIVRYFCGAPGHAANVTRRFGRLSEATRVALAIHRISAEFESELAREDAIERGTLTFDWQSGNVTHGVDVDVSR